MPRCAPDGSQVICPGAAFGAPVQISTMLTVPGFGHDVGLGCASP